MHLDTRFNNTELDRDKTMETKVDSQGYNIGKAAVYSKYMVS